MAVISVKTSKKFKIFFQNNEGKIFDITYKLHSSLIAEKWFNKIKHLYKIPIDSIESGLANTSDLDGIYEEFCNFANLPYEQIDLATGKQETLNFLHEVYEKSHDRLSRLPNNQILYKFHHAIHDNEEETPEQRRLQVGWGTKEGPLTEQFMCNSFFEDEICKNFIYATESELGKSPHQYWSQKEPNDQARILELCKPHMTLRAKFFIALQDKRPEPFQQEFVEWIQTHMQEWLAQHNLATWRPVDEQSAPLLAHTDYKGNLSGHRFSHIEI